MKFRESRFGCPRIARVTSSEEMGTMSKNNLRGIPLGKRPIWGIHSLTLIISWGKANTRKVNVGNSAVRRCVFVELLNIYENNI